MILSSNYDYKQDELLIEKAVVGDKNALERLIKNHQDYIYNISLKMFANVDDALDATQEVLIKVITGLKTFKGESQFRTWLYRIAFNHFLNSHKKKMELVLQETPSQFGGFTEETETQISEAEVEEVRVLCSTAMLMCLNREQRLLYIVGEVFGADHQLGAELFELTPVNYRVKLHRAKADLINFVSGKCGIINPANPCRCPKKTRTLIQKGFIEKEKLSFNRDYEQKVNELVANQKDEVSDKLQLELKELFQNSPFQVKRQIDVLIESLVK